MIQRLLIFLVLVLLPIISSAQKRVEVKDPEIKFSYVLPDGWQVKDDGYDYKILSKTIDNAVISMTYLEGAQGTGSFETLSSQRSFEEDFLFTVRYTLPQDYPNLKVQENGTTTIDDTSTNWVKFQHGKTGDQVGVFYMFEKLNQTFTITVSSPAGEFEKLQPVFTSVINSFHAEKL